MFYATQIKPPKCNHIMNMLVLKVLLLPLRGEFLRSLGREHCKIDDPILIV